MSLTEKTAELDADGSAFDVQRPDVDGWRKFYDVDPQGLNRVIPVAWTIGVVGFAFIVERVVELVVLGGCLCVGNMMLGTIAHRLKSVAAYHRLEWARMACNVTIECALITLYAAQAPIWLLALPGALAFPFIWRGRALLAAELLHLIVLTSAMVASGATVGAVLVMLSTYGLCAGIATHLMGKLRGLLAQRDEAFRYALALQRDQLHQDVAQQRRAALASAGQLAAGIAHEVNNPLFAVLGNLAFVQDRWRTIGHRFGAKTELEVGEALDDTRHAATSIGSIIKSMTEFSRSKAEQAQLIEELAGVVGDAVKMVRPLLSEGVELTCELNECPVVLANPSGITQIVVNLVKNANDAVSRSGHQARRICVRTHADLLARAVIEVSDTGAGIAAEDMTSIFTPFFTTSPGRGSGLGLPIVHELVEALGARIDVTSSPGEGSTFSVCIPSARREENAHHDDEDPQASASGAGLRILVIDDDADVARMLVRLIADMDTVSAPNATKARELLRTDPAFDAVLCDVVMPGESGIELFQQLVESEPEYAERWIFMSGGALEPSEKLFLEESSSRLLFKPVVAAELREAILSVQL